MDVSQLLNNAKRPEKIVPLCLAGDLQAKWEALHEEYGRKVAAAGRKMANADARELSAKIVAVEEQMAEQTLEVVVRGLPRNDWKALVRDHPPREGVEADKQLGVNQESFTDAMVYACIVSPEMTDDEKATLLDVITDAQYEKLTEAAWNVNRRDLSVPFSPIASRTTPSTGEASGRPSDSASRRGGSRGGSRRK